MGPGEDAEDTDQQEQSNSIADYEESLRDTLEADIAEKTGAADDD